MGGLHTSTAAIVQCHTHIGTVGTLEPPHPRPQPCSLLSFALHSALCTLRSALCSRFSVLALLEARSSVAQPVTSSRPAGDRDRGRWFMSCLPNQAHTCTVPILRSNLHSAPAPPIVVCAAARQPRACRIPLLLPPLRCRSDRPLPLLLLILLLKPPPPPSLPDPCYTR